VFPKLINKSLVSIQCFIQFLLLLEPDNYKMTIIDFHISSMDFLFIYQIELQHEKSKNVSKDSGLMDKSNAAAKASMRSESKTNVSHHPFKYVFTDTS
jgi:hypothetical protein